MDHPQVVFILSTNYAGSHLLSHLLAAHSRCAAVGELHNYRKFRERGSRSGNVENDYLDHPAFAGLDALPVRRWHQEIYDRLKSGQPDLACLIDNSKRPGWARRFPAETARPLHLLRDPRALVSRWLRTDGTGLEVRRQRRRMLRRRPWNLAMPADAVTTYLQKWLITNQVISRFLGPLAPVNLVTYLDLAGQTGPTLETLMPTLGLTFEAGQLDYGANPPLGTRKREYVAAARASAITLDQRWREHLSASDIQRIEADRAVRAYLQNLGLRWAEDGLTRRR